MVRIKIEAIAIPILIEQFQYIFDQSIEEEQKQAINFRQLRFNLAAALLELHGKIGKLPFSHVWN